MGIGQATLGIKTRKVGERTKIRGEKEGKYSRFACLKCKVDGMVTC